LVAGFSWGCASPDHSLDTVVLRCVDRRHGPRAREEEPDVHGSRLRLTPTVKLQKGLAAKPFWRHASIVSPPKSAARKRPNALAAKRTPAPVVRPHPRDEVELRSAADAAERAEGLLMSVDEAERAIVTGRWPDSSE
jgi:hypothetical protein